MRAVWLMVSVSFRASRRNAILLCLTTPLGWLSPAVAAVATKLLVDGEVIAGAIAALSVALTLASMQLSLYLVHALGKQVDAYIQQRLAELMTRPPGIEHYERADYLDQVQLLREQSDWIGAGLNATVQLSAAACQVAVVCSLLATQAPWLLLLVLFAVPSFAASVLSRRINDRALTKSAEPDRLQHKLIRLTFDVPAGREARLFGLRDELLVRRRRLSSIVNAERNRALLLSEVAVLVGRVIFGVGYLGAIVLVLRSDLGPGDVAMIVVLASQVEGFLGNIVGGAQFMIAVFQVAARMRWLESYAAAAGPTGTAPTTLRSGIRLEHVCFRYPATDTTVLNDVSVLLPAGAVIALVGDNGAGKTSLVKLLLGMYRPTSGRILLDDVDLGEVAADDWRRHTSAAFQDYARLEFLASQAIGLDRYADETAVRQAIDTADARDVVPSLDTQLGATWPGGIDLSGGQWQRIALARGHMRPTPLLLVLDEPTASLDADAEHALFERYAATTGAVTLLVTHRFSTVRMADLILVLSGGRLREQGTHEELIAQDGLYAELYRLQAKAYS